MKIPKILSLVLAIILFSSLLIVPALAEDSEAEELLVNGTFEDANGKGVSTGWIFENGRFGTDFFLSEDAHDGPFSMQLMNDKEKGCYIKQWILIVPGEDYEISGWLKATGKNSKGGAISYGFYSTDADNKRTVVPSTYKTITYADSPRGKWKQHVIKTTAPEEADTLLVSYRMLDAGELYWDSLSVKGKKYVRVPTQEELELEELMNVDFTADWFSENLGMDKEAMEEYASRDSEYVMPLDDAGFTDISGAKYVDAVNLLGKLGIVKGRDEGKYEPEASLTRAEAVTILLRVFGGEDYKGEPIFTDVTKDHWAYSNVMSAYSIGMVNGMDAQTFAPDIPVTYEQAVKMIVAALGYENEAEAMGGYPLGYLAKGESIGTLKDTEQETNAPVSRGIMAMLMANSIDVTILGVKYADPYKKVLLLKNAPAQFSSLPEDVPMANVDGTPVSALECREWDTVALLHGKNGDLLKVVRKAYKGGDAAYINPENHNWKWILENKIKGLYGFIYFLDDQPKYMDRPFNAGLNTFIATLRSKWYRTEDGKWTDDSKEGTYIHRDARADYLKEDLAEIIKADKKYNMQTIVKIKFPDPDICSNTEYGAFVTGTSREMTKTPCPHSEGYWNRLVTSQFAAVAETQKIMGVCIDAEMYSADATHYYGPCYCNDCYNRFLNERGYADDTDLAFAPVTKRVETVKKKGIIEEYEWWSKRETIRVLHKVERKLHAINPNLIISGMPRLNHMVGMEEGLGTPENPFLIFSESEYAGIMIDSLERQKLIEDSGMPIRSVIGLWNNPVPPSQFASKMEQAASISDGAWIYTGVTLTEGSKYSYKHDEELTPERYLEAIADGSRRIDENLKTGKEVPIDQYKIPEYTAKRIDGTPTEEDWANAPYTDDFQRYRTGGTPSVRTAAQMLWNGERLFVRITNYEPRMKDLEPGILGKDPSGFWDDSQQINEVLWRFEEGFEGLHACVNQGGGIQDRGISGIGTSEVHYDFDINSDVKHYNDRFVVTIDTPLSFNEQRWAQPGETIRMQIGRRRTWSSESDGEVNFSWAVTSVYLTAINLWGKVTLAP